MTAQPTSPQLSLLMACSSLPLRAQIRSLLNRETGWRLCGEADTGAVALDLFWRYRPDVVLVDLGLADSNGFHLIEVFKRSTPSCKVVLLSHAADSFVEKVARLMGADHVCHTAGKLNPILALLRQIAAQHLQLKPTLKRAT